MTFGGGYAMIPIVQRELVENRGWTTSEELMDYYAIAQCTPGVIFVNTATFIGSKRAGILGGIFATLGLVLPSLIIISVLAGLIQAFSSLAWVAHAFAAIRVCVVVLALNAVIKLWKNAVVDIKTLAIFLAVLLFSMFTDLSPVVFIVGAAVLGIIIKAIEGSSSAASDRKGGDSK